MHVEHELRQRPFQACALPNQKRESGARDSSRAFEVHDAERLSEVVMRACRETQIGFRSPVTEHDVVLLTLPHRHRFVKEVGDSQQQVVQLRAQSISFSSQ